MYLADNIITQVLKIDPAKLDALNDLCEIGCKDPDIDEIVFDEEVVFGDGMRFAIQVIMSESDITEQFPPLAWTQGVLFTAEGQEIGYTEVGDRVDGQYIIDVDKDRYVVIVEAE